MLTDAKSKIVDILLGQEQAAYSTDGKQVSFRCPFCKDSESSRTIKSFSVKIDVADNEPMVYQCFRARCRKKGKVDQEFLEMLGVNDHRLILEVNKHNRKSKTKIRSNRIGNFETKGLSLVPGKDTDLNVAKLGYLSKRLGHKFTLEDVFKYKIVLDFVELLTYNDIEIPKKQEYKYKLYSLYGLGFLSMYNDFVVIRDVSNGKLYSRYSNENIFNATEDVTKFYIIPTKIDLLDPSPTIINVSEGIISILGVYFNTDIDRKYNNQIFAAACGAGITNLVLHIVKTYALTNIKVNIFSDSEIPKSDYNNLKKLIKYVESFDVKIHYNSISDDFGHTENDIKIITSELV